MEPEFILTRSPVEALGATELEGQLLMLVRMLELCMLHSAYHGAYRLCCPNTILEGKKDS